MSQIVPHSTDRSQHLKALEFDSKVVGTFLDQARTLSRTETVSTDVIAHVNKEMAAMLASVMLLLALMKKGLIKSILDNKIKLLPFLGFAISTQQEIKKNANLDAAKTISEDDPLQALLRAGADIGLDTVRLMKFKNKKLTVKSVIAAFRMDVFTSSVNAPDNAIKLIVREFGPGGTAAMRAATDLICGILLDALEEENV